MDHTIKLFQAFVATTLAMALILVAAPAEAQSCGACANIEIDDEDFHWAVAWWNDSGPAGPYHWNNESGTCGSHHTWCDDSGQMWLSEAVIDAVEREDVNSLSDLVTASSAVIVESRQAIQIPGCDGEFIVGHVPVGDALMASLRVAVSKLTDL